MMTPMNSIDDVKALLERLPEDQRKACLNFLSKNGERMLRAPGSTHNHQAWKGGYLDHVAEVMKLAIAFYDAFVVLGRPLPFTPADALVVLFLHDAEKPWRIIEHEGGYAHGFPKDQADVFRERLLQEYGIWGTLTAAQRDALLYVEGEKDRYTPDQRNMSELAAFCHLCDVTSARIFHDYPRRNR
jgi:hypothetical protein